MENKIRSLLSQRRTTLGTHLSSTWPTLWEVVGATGLFDYIEFGGQYGAWDLHDLDNLCRAAELTRTGTMIKIDRPSKDWIAQRAIAAGFEAVLFADIGNAAEAKECVKAVKLPPEGVNGFHSTRGLPIADYAMAVAPHLRNEDYAMRSLVPSLRDDYAKHIDDIVIAIMIEKNTLMDELEEVLAIDGVDMIQFGPVDYGLSLRTPGQPFNMLQFREKIEAEADRAIQMAIDAGVHPRIEVLSAEACKGYLDRGILDFCIGSDILMVEEWCLQHGKRFREMVSLGHSVNVSRMR